MAAQANYKGPRYALFASCGFASVDIVSHTGIPESFWSFSRFPRGIQMEGFSYQEALKMLSLSEAKSDDWMALQSTDI